jgi:bifunctional DNA-binding transcriptional regulator/antitoxin component of YhaV-PrlF toxin-antitoxin module
MEVVEVADRYRITVTQPIRKFVPLEVGQKVAVIPFGERILIHPLPKEPDKRLVELTEGITFDRATRKKASRAMVSQVKK